MDLTRFNNKNKNKNKDKQFLFPATIFLFFCLVRERRPGKDWQGTLMSSSVSNFQIFFSELI